ncbi:hypothetical protein BDN72DRAFT_841994 [Pluteus cervinus]|uniref:Uncharacterized protein n=1 Tax=Pluteus cervinus TaxID=181527 RepID=A0ACD3ARY5_9AGAR|nr:hypothetical protein BDN72DRAFT_841994 [Pluteus cervinus]
MHSSAFSLLAFLALADVALSICPGFNYGVTTVQSLGDNNAWMVYDDSCTLVDMVIEPKNGNPCTSRTFGCSPPPVTINTYMNTQSKLVYACRPAPGAGQCQGVDMAVCCRNDGH